MKSIVKIISLSLLAIFMLGYLLYLRTCTAIEKDKKETEVVQYRSNLMQEGEYYFVIKQYRYSKVGPDFVGGSSIINAYGVKDKNGKIIFKPMFVYFPDFVKISEYGDDGKHYETSGWWTIGRVKSSRFFPFIEEYYTDEFFTVDGKEYVHKNKKYCIIKAGYNAHLLDLKSGEFIFSAYEMDWKSSTEIIYWYANLETHQFKMPKTELKFIERK